MAVSSVKAIVNGVTQNLIYNASTGAYEASIVSPSNSSFSQSGGYYNVQILAYDDSGNSVIVDSADGNLGDALKLYVRETAAPTITTISPTDSAVLSNNLLTISWSLADNDSGINTSTIKLFIDGAEVDGTINVTASSNTYTCTYTPTTALTDGTHTFKYSVSDNDGNSATKEISVKIDTIPPSLNISQPENGAKVNVNRIMVSGYTNDLTSSPVSVTVNEASASVDSNGYFSTTVTLTAGDNAITVTATDSAGKSTSIVLNVNYNANPPVIESVVIAPNPVEAGNSFTISAVVTDE